MLGALLALPLQAQVHIDSTEVARILQGVPPKTPTICNEQPNDSDDEGEDTILPFQEDNGLSWQENITTRLNSILQADIASTMQVGLMVWDLTDDKLLYASNERVHLRPASTMKCVTAIAALYRLGPNYNYRTDIYHTGSIDDSTHVLNGDIYCDYDFSGLPERAAGHKRPEHNQDKWQHLRRPVV